MENPEKLNEKLSEFNIVKLCDKASSEKYDLVMKLIDLVGNEDNPDSEKINEIWDEIFELQEQHVTIYEKLDKQIEMYNSLRTSMNDMNNKLDRILGQLIIKHTSPMPKPEDISYWINFGHFPEKEKYPAEVK